MKGKRSCLDIFLLSNRQSGIAHQYLFSHFLGVSILQILIIYRIYDYLICWRCHGNGVSTVSRLPNISEVKTRNRRNMIGIDMIPNNHIGHNICNFDIPLIVNKLEECNLYTTFCATVKDFVDTMKVAKKNKTTFEVSNCQVQNIHQWWLVAHYLELMYLHTKFQNVQSNDN